MTEPQSLTIARAKSLRTNQTEAEARLWYHLRAHRFLGLKFKRQKPVGRYIVDFVCWERRVIVELDGGQHAEQAADDRQRDAWLRSQGYAVLRFWNHEVMQQLEGVLEQIRCAVAREPSPLSLTLSPEGRGDGSRPAERVTPTQLPALRALPSPPCGTAEGSLRSSGAPAGVLLAGGGAGGEGAAPDP